jgi:hypothetical protein
LNHSMPHDSVLSIQNIHWVLRIRQFGIEGSDVINNDIHRRPQTIL